MCRLPVNKSARDLTFQEWVALAPYYDEPFEPFSNIEEVMTLWKECCVVRCENAPNGYNLGRVYCNIIADHYGNGPGYYEQVTKQRDGTELVTRIPSIDLVNGAFSNTIRFLSDS